MSIDEDPLRKAGIFLVWGDSLGAKSFCVTIRSGGVKAVIDPGAAVMHPKFPLPREKKSALVRVARNKILNELKDADIVIITHYHHDHYLTGVGSGREHPYRGKKILMKNPNKYINLSQWNRARKLIQNVIGVTETEFLQYLTEPSQEDFPDPTDSLQEAMGIDVGDYSTRRKELLNKGEKWFRRLSQELWCKRKWVTEVTLEDGTSINWAENSEIYVGSALVKFGSPWFHGVEYARTGWVIPVTIESRGTKVVISSDVMGPTIEDYAWEIIKARPDAILLDGPSTYLFPYMLNKVNLSRAINNAIRIIEESKPKVIIYDHHLLREKLWREKVKPVFQIAYKVGVVVVTVAEYSGQKPILEVNG